MNPAFLLLLPFLIVLGLLWFRPLGITGRSDGFGLTARGRTSRDAEIRAWGWVPVVLAVLLAGWAFIFGFMWVIGEISQQLEPVVDEPAFDIIRSQQTDFWDSTLAVLTQIGNRRQIQLVAVVAAAVLAWAYRRVGWWIPPVALFVSYLVEKSLQEVLAVTVDRGHPPTTLGTFPSGGVARVAVIWGVIVLLIILIRPATGHAARWSLWAVVVLGVGVESVARAYNLQHWLTDVVASWLFGPLTLALMSVAIMAVTSARRSDRPALR